MALTTARPIVVIPLRIAAASSTWTAMPAALTEWNNSTAQRVKYDLSAVSQARIFCRVSTAGSASAEVRIQYSSDESTWNYLDGGTGPTLAINTTGTLVGAWVLLAAAARGDFALRMIGINGDASAAPVFANFGLQVR